MARAAVSGRLAGRLTWQAARLVAARAETPTARTLMLAVPGWPGHLAGQHVDLRLTAEDGYQAVRSYSLAAPSDGERVEVTIQRVADGEVSPYLTDVLSPGDLVELRGPAGGWFVWRPDDPSPLLLVAGGAGVVPLMAMVRARRAAGNPAPCRLVCSVRSPTDRYYAGELDELRRDPHGPAVSWVYTRVTPPGSSGYDRPAGRLGAADLADPRWAPERDPACFVCGPTGFVESVAGILVAAGHDPRRVRTERFGPSGD